MSKKLVVDAAAIIERGFATCEEYDALNKAGKMEKLNIVDKGGELEGIWIAPLEKSGVVGKRFHFVFFNDPIMFLGAPRPTAGMVGIATSSGVDTRAQASAEECWGMFKQVGEAAIASFNADHAKLVASEKKKKANKKRRTDEQKEKGVGQEASRVAPAGP